jgi:excisionase family DNA binding protein
LQGAVSHPELPSAYIGQPRPAEPYAIWAWCKKSTANDILVPLARRPSPSSQDSASCPSRTAGGTSLGSSRRLSGTAETRSAWKGPPSVLPFLIANARKERPIKPDQCPEFEERFLSVAAIAQRLGVSEKTIRRKIDRGELPAHRVGRLLRVGEGALAAYVARACLSKGQIGS